MPLEILDVSSGYGDMEIVHGVTVDVPTSKVTAIIGPNGAGKSTLIKTIYGFIRPRRGQITFEGQDLARHEVHELVHLGLLYIQQGHSAFPDLTIEENLMMSAFTIAGRESRAAAVHRAYEMFPTLHARRRQLAGTLSGGERRFLELARIVMLTPRLVLLDEPSLGVAPKMMRQIYETIMTLNAKGIGFLIVEQNVRIALNAADQVFVLETGRVRWSGSPAALHGNEALRDLYLGAPLAARSTLA